MATAACYVPERDAFVVLDCEDRLWLFDLLKDRWSAALPHPVRIDVHKQSSWMGRHWINCVGAEIAINTGECEARLHLDRPGAEADLIVRSGHPIANRHSRLAACGAGLFARLFQTESQSLDEVRNNPRDQRLVDLFAIDQPAPSYGTPPNLRCHVLPNTMRRIWSVSSDHCLLVVEVQEGGAAELYLEYWDVERVLRTSLAS